MPGARRQDLLGRLADISEEAIQRLADAPGGDRLLQVLNGMKDRVDELQRRVRGLEELEQRLAALEQKVDRLAKGETVAARRGGSAAPAARSPRPESPKGGPAAKKP